MKTFSQTIQQNGRFFSRIVSIIRSDGSGNSVMRQQGLSGLGILGRNEIDLPKCRKSTDREIIRMSDRHADDE